MRSIIYILLNYINGAFKDDTYYYIAKKILTNLEKVRTLALEDCAVLCECSASTLNRFCKKIGFANYSSFRNILRVQDDSLLPMMESEHERLPEALSLIDNMNVSYFQKMSSLILNSKKIVMLGYGEFQYTALYFQKQMYTLGKLIEVHNVYIDNYDFSLLQNNDLVIIVSMNGEFLKPNVQHFKKAVCHKVAITMNDDANFIGMFDTSIILPKTELSYTKYLLFRTYEKIIEAYRTMRA